MSQQRGKGPSLPLSILRTSHRPPILLPHSLEGLGQTPQPWGSSPLPSGSLPTSCDATWREQLSHCLPHPSTAHPCLPTAWKGQEGSPNSGKCRTTTINPPEVRTSALHNTHVTALHCPTAGSSPHIPCSLQLLLLPTLTVRANLQQKCHMKPPRSCKPHAWPLTTQRERDRPGAPLSATLVLPIPQGSTGLTQHSAGSKTSTSLATENPGQPLWLHPTPKWATAANAGYTQVPSLGSSTALPQGHQPSQKEPRLLALATPLCPKQEAGDKHKQPPNLWAPSKPRLSPAGAVPAEPRAGTPGYIHLQLRALYW